MLRIFIFFTTTPLIFASSLGDYFLEHSNQKIELKTIKKIYKYEKKINGDSRDIVGTPLYFAAKSGSLSLVTFLVKNGADVNKANGFSDTPLHVASAYGHLDIVKYLISHKAKKSKKNSISKTALELAKLRGRTSVVNYFKKSTSNKKIKIIKQKKTTKSSKKESETFNHLPYVKTLGVVSQSKPFVEP
jgi:ankyrin repeat protein